MSAILEAALAYAAKNLPVFPCGPDKAPRTRNGYKDATTDTATITEHWTRHPNDLIAIPTGRKTDLYVLDVDAKHGIDGRKSLKALGLDLSQCPMAVTPTSGNHYSFRLAGRALRNTAGKLGPGLDTRGDGGYIIVPPSTGERDLAHPRITRLVGIRRRADRA